MIYKLSGPVTIVIEGSTNGPESISHLVTVRQLHIRAGRKRQVIHRYCPPLLPRVTDCSKLPPEYTGEPRIGRGRRISELRIVDILSVDPGNSPKG